MQCSNTMKLTSLMDQRFSGSFSKAPLMTSVNSVNSVNSWKISGRK